MFSSSNWFFNVVLFLESKSFKFSLSGYSQIITDSSETLPVAEIGNFFLISSLFSEFNRNSSFKLVFIVSSRINSSGKSSNTQVISICELSFEIHKSYLSGLPLKKISKASNIVDLPTSFYPIITFKSEMLILVSWE